jgi:dTDP-glucose 4,6-dehydratase
MDAILVTGADGFIGSHFVDYALRNTDKNLVLVCSWRRGGMGHRLRSLSSMMESLGDRVCVITHDLSAPFSTLDVDTIRSLGVSHIVHFAAESHVDRSISHPSDVIKNNVMVTINALDLARKISGLKSFVQISTDEVYGAATGKYCHKEWDPIIPSNPYSASKASQEAIAISYWRTYDVPVILTNTMNNIGERQSADKFLPMVISRVLSGEPVGIHSVDGVVGSRFYLHAANHADAILSILDSAVSYRAPGRSEPFSHRPFRANIVGERELNNLELSKIIAEEVGSPLFYDLVNAHTSRPGHDLRYALDGSFMEGRGWLPPVPLEDSIKSTVRWYLDHPEWLDVYIE